MFKELGELLDTLFSLNFTFKMRKITKTWDNEICFYTGCKSTALVEACQCGDHSYGPPANERQYNKGMCSKHAAEHTPCAGWGHW